MPTASIHGCHFKRGVPVGRRAWTVRRHTCLTAWGTSSPRSPWPKTSRSASCHVGWATDRSRPRSTSTGSAAERMGPLSYGPADQCATSVADADDDHGDRTPTQLVHRTNDPYAVTAVLTRQRKRSWSGSSYASSWPTDCTPASVWAMSSSGPGPKDPATPSASSSGCARRATPHCCPWTAMTPWSSLQPLARSHRTPAPTHEQPPSPHGNWNSETSTAQARRAEHDHSCAPPRESTHVEAPARDTALARRSPPELGVVARCCSAHRTPPPWSRSRPPLPRRGSTVEAARPRRARSPAADCPRSPARPWAVRGGSLGPVVADQLEGRDRQASLLRRPAAARSSARVSPDTPPPSTMTAPSCDGPLRG